ncbi:hypothetical protein DJ013_02210 [Arcticibacterium luteifluviistationis]|uniref:Dolichol-phosphate mannosyltransferase subunit 3 n=2 Tax=Arcticibacterium luteifluviistationis TaxID=1784714 RepID=A0A2Z4G7J0_9BACT|nr:hypothetical protein DJ013_02210 [Arcticibacterium luteifluviistationis]
MAATTLLMSGGWLLYIIWSYIIENTGWEIDPDNTESMLKFFALIIPALMLSVSTLLSLQIGKLSEVVNIENQNKILKKKIEKRELELKLEKLEK